ncbi:Hypoxanthine/guanine phosphoribosyltransferase [Candidatus Methanobinarius endosymbioticus]|uniref:Hypoxanthine/guanine phosphoribosyltransferase n=1 Tax=Candidatus Methanobinarius endosymbioticus TaxID=2006182 RepID=A0A366MCS1_9EURY|nr:Hypoxanthine/guanine phosphoribosyltransferase [Candidatus Methanobinarius endosymbioticus]
MLEKFIKSLKASPIVKKGEYDYFVHPVSDGVPEMEPKILKEITAVIQKKTDLDVNKIVCVEAMGIHLATALSLETGIPFVVIRKREYGLLGEVPVFQKTGYSEQKLYINSINKGDKIFLIDDVVSTGGTYIAIIKALQKMEVEIKDAIAIIEKGDGKKIVEEETSISLKTMAKLDLVDGKVIVESTIEDN